MSNRRLKSKIKHLQNRIHDFSKPIPKDCFSISPILRGYLPIYPESQEFSTVLPHVIQQGYSANSIAMITRSPKTDRENTHYQIYPYHGIPTTLQIPSKLVIRENNIFHHPEMLGQSVLPILSSNSLKRETRKLTHDTHGKIRVDQYFR
jgi:hypothetical protein